MYLPKLAMTGAAAIVYLHGGGWVMCDLDSHDAICRRLSLRTGAVVVSVHYRRAPESPFPAALDDAYAALRWLHARADQHGIDSDRIAIAGDSSGGNLAAATAILARDRGGPTPRCQVLLYPVTDCRLDSPSYQRFARAGGFLTLPKMTWYWEQYRPTGPRDHPYCAPLRAQLVGLPPTLLVIAECDPLNYEGHAYARKLEAAGVAVTAREYRSSFHAFFGLADTFAVAREAEDDVVSWLSAQLAG